MSTRKPQLSQSEEMLVRIGTCPQNLDLHQMRQRCISGEPIETSTQHRYGPETARLFYLASNVLPLG